MLVIDGSSGEGGGQILRTSLAMSLVTGKGVRIENIRGRRAKPGLLHQHLTAVKAAATIGRAHTQGAELGSRVLEFTPGEVEPGQYRFAVGTAGSATLVLQTVLPPLLVARGPCVLTLEGGTHNPHAPPFDFLQKTFLPLVNRMGPQVTAALERPGFYPRGGGRFTVTIEPATRLAPLHILHAGAPGVHRARAVIAGLPRHIAERELSVVAQMLSWGPDCLSLEELPGAYGPGNVIMIEIASQQMTEVITGFGEKGVRAEAVAERAARSALRYLEAGVPVGEHLADQLLIPLALAGAGSFKTLPLTQHA